MARHPVNHGVLDQGLQYQARHPHGGYFRRIRQLDLEAIGEAPLLQLQVELRKLQLVGQPRKIPLAGVEQAPQEIRELHHHGLRRLRIPLDVPADGVQQIEQSMRRELHAQRRQAGGAPLALQRGEPQFRIAKARIQRQTGDQGQSEPIRGQKTHEAGDPERHPERVAPGADHMRERSCMRLVGGQDDLERIITGHAIAENTAPKITCKGSAIRMGRH